MSSVAWSVAALVVLNLSLAASVLALRIRNDLRDRRVHRIEGRWYPALLDLLAGDTTVSVLLSHVVPSETVAVLEICGRLVRRVSGDDRAVIQEFARPLLGSLKPMFVSRHPEQRANAIQLLTSLGTDDEFRTEILEALTDPSPLVSMVAARVVASRRRVDLGAVVLAQLDRFGMWSEAFLASMLASMGADIAHDLRAYFSDPDCSRTVRAVTARALAELRDVSAGTIAALLIARDRPEDRELVVASLRVIEAVGQSKHVDVVRPLLAHEDPVVRAQTAIVLGNIGDASDGRALAHAVGDESPWVAIYAATALRRLGQDATLRILSSAPDTNGEAALEALQEAVL